MEYSTLIRKKNNGYQYVITYKTMGKWKQKSKQGFNKKGEAQKAMSEMIPQLEKMVRNNVTSDNVTLESFYNMYLKHIILYREENTIKIFKTAMTHFKVLNDKDLNKITTLDIQKCVDEMTYKGLKEKSITLYLGFLKRLLRASKEEYKLICEAPNMKAIIIRVDKEKKEKRALNKNEIDKLLYFLKDTHYYLIVLTALKTGLRIGEILGLTWNNIDFDNNKIKVVQQWKKLENKTHGFGTLKSKNSYREIPIPDTLSDELKKVTPRNIENRVFDNKSTSAVVINLNRKLRNFNITIHELRHTYATGLISSGIDFKTVAYLMGHDVKQLTDTYSHVNEDMLNNASETIKKFL